MQRVRIAIDPKLKSRFGPEISWTWRLLLAGIGLPWAEVSLDDSQCDIAYVTSLQLAVHCRFAVLANLNFWEQRSRLRLGGVGRYDGGWHPIYRGERSGFQFTDVTNDKLICHRDIVFDVFWLATGQEEAFWPKNAHGHFDLSDTVFEKAQVLRLALGSGLAAGLERVFADLGFPAPMARWPNGKRAAACVGHDVDYPEVVRWAEPLRLLLRKGRGGLPAAVSILTGKSNHWHFGSWVQLEQKLGTRSAFFFVARQGSLLKYAAGTPDPFYDVRSERFRKLFTYLSDEGFEIGLHASYRAYECREKFAAERQALAEASRQPIHGNRHHYWHLHPQDPESTLLLHEQIGLKYDTSLIHERYLGWRRGLSWPFFPFHQKERRELRTLQIPTVWMDDQLFGHRQDNPGDRLEILRALAGRAADQGGCLLIDVHDYVFDNVLYPRWAQTYRELWEYLLTRSDVWIETPGNIADHWIKRHHTIVQASQGLDGATTTAASG
jgi:hypothetical protein